jgi:DNA-3-methyladenine glycosylase II
LRIEDLWTDKDISILLKTPKEFNFLQCLKFLARSPLEPCHEVHNSTLYKLAKFDGQRVLMRIGCIRDQSIEIEFLTTPPKKSIRAKAANYVHRWFDLDTDLRPFYRMAGKDPVLCKVAADLFGLRILTIPDLFEALCWAIIGQQINLRFAYTLKRRFVETFGEKFIFHRRPYYLFPTPQTVSCLRVADIRGLQFTGRKSEYIIGLAQRMRDGDLTREGLLRHHNFKSARKELMQLRGVGQWTAAYVSLRCLKDPLAFPVADVGLQNAVRQQLGMNEKPTIEDMHHYSEAWMNWQAYATFYLWSSLIG